MTGANTSTVELQLRAAIDAAPSGLLMTDVEGRVVLVNRQIESTFGYAREELLGKSIEMLIPERFRAAHPAQRKDFLTSPRVRAMGMGRDLFGLRKDGTEVPVEIGLTPVATGQGLAVLATVIDVSARKRAEERFRVAVESSPNGMLMIDREGRILLVNHEIELCPSGGPILGNPTHFEHLIINALDAMLDGGSLRIATRDVELTEPLQTRGRTLPAGPYVVLEVTDSGVGMDHTTQERIFEPFFTTKDEGKGTGLGLYTVYTIVEQLEGGIDFESEIGRGTRFAIHLPRDQRLHTAAASSVSAMSPVSARAASSGVARILIVEDERLIRTTLRHLLSAHGYHVLAAEDAKSALDVSRGFAGTIDLILSDIVLPDASGPDLAILLRESRPDARVLFMSAYPADLLVQQGRVPAGMRTLEKPFDEPQLLEAVRSALSVERAAAPA